MNARLQMQTISKVRSSLSSTPVLKGLLQRKCACGNHTVAGGECTECAEKKTNLQRKTSNQSESTEVPPIVHEVLNSPGRPLDEGHGLSWSHDLVMISAMFEFIRMA